MNSYVQDIKKDKDDIAIISDLNKNKTNIFLLLQIKHYQSLEFSLPIKKLIESVRDTPLTRIYSFDNKNIF